MIKLCDLVDYIPNNQEIIVIVNLIEYSKYCDTITENRIDIRKYRFDNLAHIQSSEFYATYRDYYIDHVYAYHDSLCIYIYDV